MKTIIAIVYAVLLLTACNTVQGVGEDIEKAGKAISNEAEKASK